MKKTPNLFLRDFAGDPRYVMSFTNPVSAWVQAGEGIATEKIDGTACLVRDGVLWARYDRKRGKPDPGGWIPCEDAPDPVTGHWPGWVRVDDQPQYCWHREASISGLADGTYELIGPRVQGNPHGVSEHVLRRHGDVVLRGVPTDYAGLRAWLAAHPIEGVVWHHPDGRMVKSRAVDFGLAWPR